MARQAAQRQNWAVVHQGATQILQIDPAEPEGYFLMGLSMKAARRQDAAVQAFEKVISLDSKRYDASIELANQYFLVLRTAEAYQLLESYSSQLSNSPRYLDMAGTIYADLGLSEKAWPFYKRAVKLQPDIDLFQANLAACATFLGKIEKAEKIYRKLLAKNPSHQRNHYHLSRLRTATDPKHVKEMEKVLEGTRQPAERNIFLYYAIGKEYEDLEDWPRAFEYYQKGGDAVSAVSQYTPDQDVELIDTIIECCTPAWLAAHRSQSDSRPIFVLGLPRTGSTMTERIISNHSQITSVGETQHLEALLKRHSGVESDARMTVGMIRSLVDQDETGAIGEAYKQCLSYLVENTGRFLEKLPYNFLYAGFIASLFPEAKLVYVRRNPMDTCFAMYKQVFTWAYQYTYRLDHLATYYLAHRRLLAHWQETLGDQLIIVDYEDMVQQPEQQTRRLLDLLDLPFEPACLDIQANQNASSTASSIQVREAIHTRSIGKWTHFNEQLEPLRARLEDAGIDC
ncbi:MAG: sulfotransferase [Proteobacteria bacterium]|nr:sulfotransferase [Pseudomonadota bacterium]